MKQLYEKVNEVDLRKTAAGVALGASLLGLPADAISASLHSKGAPATAKHHHHQKVKVTSWDEAMKTYRLDPDIVAKVIAAESTDPEGMKAVACVIQNRQKKKPWMSAKDVAVEKFQFQPLTRPDMMEDHYKKLKAEADGLSKQIGSLEDITDGATQFRSKHQYDAHKAYLDKHYDVTKTIGGNVFMKAKDKHEKTA